MSLKRIPAILIVLVCIVSMFGVSLRAEWMYPLYLVENIDQAFDIRIDEFNWEGSGFLPDDNEIGENHLDLIHQIVSHPEHGLNTKNSYLNEQIANRKKGGLLWSGRDTLGSMAVDQSEELSEIFGLTASNLEFLIQFVNDNEYYIFTTNVELGERGEINILGNNSKPGRPLTQIGLEIYPIYRTKIVKTSGVWAPLETKIGHATSAWYEESRRNANATQIPSFDPDTFKEGSI